MKNNLTLLLILISSLLFAQEETSLFIGPIMGVEKNTISFSPLFGKTIKHNERFTVPIQGNAYGFELSYHSKLNGKKSWHHNFKNIEFGYSLLYADFGSDAIGKVVAAYPHLTINIFQKRDFSTFFRMGAGFSYISNPYNVKNNPENVAIGSHYNNFFNFRLGMRYRIAKKISLELAGSFLHASNSRLSLPNLGANMGMANLSVLVELKDQKYFEQTFKNNSKPTTKFNYFMSLGYAPGEKVTQGGPRYHNYMTLVGMKWNVKRKWSLEANFNYIISRGEYHFAKLNYSLPKDANLFWQTSDLAFYVGPEMYMGRMSLFFQVGQYIYNPYFKAGFLPSRIGARAYLGDYKKDRNLLYLELFMRNHFAIADFLSFNVGWKF